MSVTMDTIPDPNDLLGDNIVVLQNLKSCLDKNNDWQLVVEALENYDFPVIFNPLVRHKMEVAQSPSQFLLNELVMRCCKIKYLSTILRICSLNDALSYLVKAERAKILKQPGENEETIQVPANNELKLECIASGIPAPSYQWFCGNVQLKNASSSTFIIPSFSEKNVGEYYCVVSQKLPKGLHELQSHVVYVETRVHLPKFTIQLPKVISVKQNEGLILRVGTASPARFEWYKNNELLLNEESDFLQLQNISENMIIVCLASNSAGEIYSEQCHVQVILNELDVFNSVQNYAKAKFAILIANEDYINLNKLYTPAYDVITLAKILTLMNFQVLSLKNLTKDEMKSVIGVFCQSIIPDSYVFFYFVGHGFQMGDKYMMGIDCPSPQSYLRSDCVCDQEIIKEIMVVSPKLLVIILDMCLRVPDKSENPGIYTEVPNIIEYERVGSCNLVEGYATCSQLGAYEKRTGQNGLYVQHLAKFLDKDLPVTQVLQLAHADFNRCIGAEKQKPSLSFDDVKYIKLTDPLINGGQTVTSFELFNELPASGEIYFPRIKRKILVSFSKSKNIFCNAIDVQFSQFCGFYTIIATVNHNVLNTSWHVDLDEKRNLLTIESLQRVKFGADIVITLKICDLNSAENQNDCNTNVQKPLKVIDYFLINIGSPLIASVKM